jgi:hypothetical protein
MHRIKGLCERDGSRLHGLASDQTYRRVTFGLIVLSAVLALPLIHPMIGMLAPALDADLSGN